MEKVNVTDIKDEQVIDIRSQHDYQVGHLKNALNLNPSNFKKYAMDYMGFDQPMILVAGKDDQSKLEEVFALAKEMNFTQVDGYLLMDEVPTEMLQTLDTIPAEDFLNKDDDYILLDVRHPDEITRPAPEKNLVNIPFEDLINDHPSLDSHKEIFTLCGSGNRSTAAASYLSSKGFKTSVIEGGMKAIQEINKK